MELRRPREAVAEVLQKEQWFVNDPQDCIRIRVNSPRVFVNWKYYLRFVALRHLSRMSNTPKDSFDSLVPIYKMRIPSHSNHRLTSKPSSFPRGRLFPMISPMQFSQSAPSIRRYTNWRNPTSIKH